MTSENTVLLQVKNLKKYFPVTRGVVFQKQIGSVKAVDGITFDVFKGETLGLVGESGCGKSTTGRTILQLYRPTEGGVTFDDIDLVGQKGNALRKLRRRVQMIFQDPYSSLNPRMTVENIIGEPLKVHNIAKGKECAERVQELLSVVGLNPYFANRYPHEFSGGQRQRIGVARALALEPELIIADEPVSALDVSIRAQIMNLLQDLQDEYQVSYLLVAHNLATVRYLANQVAVMYLGEIVEYADTEQLYEEPLHPYTKALFSAALPATPDVQKEEIILTGEVPSPLNPPNGCRFHPRCPWAMDICSQEVPVKKELTPGHMVACHLY